MRSLVMLLVVLHTAAASSASCHVDGLDDAVLVDRASGAGKRAAVLGATGAVGTEIVKSLVARGWDSVIVLNRREVSTFDGMPGVKQQLVTFDSGEVNGEFEAACAAVLGAAPNVDALFVALGVGAPSQKGVTAAQFRRVDEALPTACARGAKTAGVKHVSILTSLGADSTAIPAAKDGYVLPRTHAGGGLYLQVKGRVENNLRGMGFASVSMFRPAALIGTPNTPRFVEIISPWVDWMLPVKYKMTKIHRLSAAMVLDAEEKLDNTTTGGAAIFEGQELHDMYARSDAEAN
jgi:nucleoside-diphosphate-sugar epimerase